MDIRPPKGWKKPQTITQAPEILPSVDPVQSADVQSSVKISVPEIDTVAAPQSRIAKKHTWRLPLLITISVLSLIVLLVAGWFFWALSPRGDSALHTRIVIEQGEGGTVVAKRLEEHGVIRSAFAFQLYARLIGANTKLRSGGYVVSSQQSVAQIIDHLSSGKTDEYSITIPPGLSLIGIRESFQKDGFSDAEITAAFEHTYTSPLLADKPLGSTLEGYIYPETYRMNADSTLVTLFERTFTELYNKMNADGTIEALRSQGLNIHQGLTLASIVQKEVSDSAVQPQVAQVFLKRLREGMILGSDVTFIYAAKIAGVAPDVSIDSPYNTRKYSGLPPGPIANMNYSAIEAVAHPATSDYLYFVAGDDGKTYFSRTEAEHNAAVALHCQKLCQ